MNNTNNLCPCGSGFLPKDCCVPLVKANAHAKTPEQLMRSRYCAFVWQESQYLFETLHPSMRENSTLQEIDDTISNINWHGLHIIACRMDGANKGFVEFAAFYRNKSNETSTNFIQQLHEHSYFVNENGRWYYLRGDILNPYKIKGNTPCWCGSGTKFKKCHGE